MVSFHGLSFDPSSRSSKTIYSHLISRLPQHPLAARSKRRSGQRERVRISITTPHFSHLSLCVPSLRHTDALSLFSTVKDKANHSVILDKATSDKLYKDVQSYRLITVATLVDRLKINGSLARKALNDLEEKGQIKKVVGHSKMSIYSMSPAISTPSQRGRR